MNYLKIYKLEGIYLGKNEITKWFSNKGSRNEVRQRIIDVFIKEAPGKGSRDNASRYIYYVETLSDGNRVYLERPANLHNGFDFLICIENANYALPSQKRRNSPKHDDLAQDLKLKKLNQKKNTHGCMNLSDVYMNVTMYLISKWQNYTFLSVFR